jgi:origin recognition complex subunit 4
MAYDEYCHLIARHKLSSSSSAAVSAVKVWSRGVAVSSWERLVEVGLLMPAGIGAAGPEARMFRVDVALEEVVGSVEGLPGVLGRWCREI